MSNDNPGRRAAATADLKTYRDSVDPIQDQNEKDSLLRQVCCCCTSLLRAHKWWCGVVVSALALINVVNQHWARLVPSADG